MHFHQWKRREFITLLGGAATWPLAAGAQQPAPQMRKVGLLVGIAERDPEAQRRIAALRQALRDSGWIEGQTVAFVARYADAKPERLPALAAELVAANVDVIVTNAAQPIEAARQATSTIPIVMASVGDALGAGYVASLARPGGNVTGLTLVATDQSAKRLQLLKEVSASLDRVAVFWNANASGHRLQMQEMELAAPTLRSRSNHIRSGPPLSSTRPCNRQVGSARKPSSRWTIRWSNRSARASSSSRRSGACP